ncbi:hypothetical protein D3C87_1941880 [compost metagenome]
MQPHQLVEAATDLEGAAELEALELHPGLDAEPLGQPGAAIGRRAADLSGDARGCSLNVGEADVELHPQGPCFVGTVRGEPSDAAPSSVHGH